MEVTTYTAFRQNLASMMDKVNNDHIPVLITRQNGSPAILMSYEDFRSYDETAFLMSDPINRAMIQEGIDQIEAGNYFQRDLIEVEDDEDAAS